MVRYLIFLDFDFQKLKNFPGCLIEPDHSYSGSEVFAKAYKFNSIKECVDLAVSVTTTRIDKKQSFWTYRVEKKLCNVMIFKLRIRSFKGHISGGSDCGYQPPDSSIESGR